MVCGIVGFWQWEQITKVGGRKKICDLRLFLLDLVCLCFGTPPTFPRYRSVKCKMQNAKCKINERNYKLNPVVSITNNEFFFNSFGFLVVVLRFAL